MCRKKSGNEITVIECTKLSDVVFHFVKRGRVLSLLVGYRVARIEPVVKSIVPGRFRKSLEAIAHEQAT